MKKYYWFVLLILPLMVWGCGGSSSSSDDDDDGDGDTPTTYTVSGTVSVQIGTLDDVTLTLSARDRTKATTTSDTSGIFTFSEIAAGDYTITPSKTDFVFTPASIDVTVSDANVTAQDFTAAIDDTTFLIAFNTVDGSDTDVWTMTLDGNNRTQLTSDTNSSLPRFSPDKTQILYAAENVTEMHTMDAHGSNDLDVTNGAANAAEFSYADDGALIVFSATTGDDFEVFSMPADASAAPTQLTALTGDNWGSVVSPNGDSVIFSSKADGGDYYDVYSVPVDGSENPIALTANNEYSSIYMAISGEGSKIAYTALYDDNSTNVFLMNAGGSNAVNISNDDGTANQSASVSYDGSKVVFDSDRDHGGNHSEIYIADADGSNLTRLTTTTDEDTSLLNYRPQFLRDGRILFLSLRDVLPQIYVMNPDGSEQTCVSDGSISDNDVLGGWDKPSF